MSPRTSAHRQWSVCDDQSRLVVNFERIGWQRCTFVGKRSLRVRSGHRAHNEAPEGTGGRTGQSAHSGSEQVQSPCAPPRDPHSVALRPSNPVPGTGPEIALRFGLAVRTCPFGQDEMYWPRL
jgi:hypothetical protein